MKYFTALFFLFFSFIPIINGQQVTKRVLVEKFTSAGCGVCTDGAAKLIDITENNPNVIWVSHHAGFIVDPMFFLEIDTIASAFTDGAPKASIDRIKFPVETYIATPRHKWNDYINTQLAQTADVDLSVSGIFDTTTRDIKLTVNTTFINAITATGEYRINVFVVEDSLINTGDLYKQSNYSNETSGHYYEGAGNPIYSYAHRYVTRSILSTAWGNGGIIPNSPIVDTTYSVSYNLNISTNYNTNRLRFVAFVTDYNEDVGQREVLNAFELMFDKLSIVSSNQELDPIFNKVRIAPNPVNNQTTLTIESEKQNDLVLILYDAVGKQIKLGTNWSITSGLNEIDLDLTALAQGIYFLQITDGKAINTQRIIKN